MSYQRRTRYACRLTRRCAEKYSASETASTFNLIIFFKSGKTVCSPQLKVNYSAQIRGHSQVTDKTGVEDAEGSRMSSGVYIVLWVGGGGHNYPEWSSR